MANGLTRALLGAAMLGAGGGYAWAAEPPAAAPDDTDLRAQVKALTDLVRTLSQQDEARIKALSAEVDALKGQLQQGRPPAGGAAVATVQTAATPGIGVAPTEPPTVGAAQAATAQPPPSATPRAVQNATARATTTVAASAQPASRIGLPRVVQNGAHRLALQSGDGQYSIGLTGDVQFDTGGYASFRPDSRFVGPQRLSSGINARRARVGIAGTAFGAWGFGLVYDTGNSSDQTPKGIETAQIVYGGLEGAALEIGYSNTFFTLDQSTGSNDTLFLERASPSNIATSFNAGDARANAGVRLFGDRYWLGGYVTGPQSGDSHAQTSERLGAFQRAAVQVLDAPDHTLHIGFDVDELISPPNAGDGTPATVSLSDQPELRIDSTTLLSTGALGTAAHPVTGGYVLDLESAATWKSLYWQGELYRYQLSRRGLADADFGGAYGQVSWTLTGEHHVYNPQAGAYFRINPAHPFSLQQGGWGAVEVAARVSYIDLDSNFRTGAALASDPAGVDGGRQVGYTLGLNWYPNDLFRFLLDYNHVAFSKANGVAVKGAVLGAPVGVQADSVALRAQVAF